MNLHTKICFVFVLRTFAVGAQYDVDSASIGTANRIVHCGTTIPPSHWEMWFSDQIERAKGSAGKPASPAEYVVPVIVHLIHGGEDVSTFPNVSQAQVYSQIRVLNDDFSGQGLNAQQLASTGFSTVGAANCNIRFCLAQFDPQGAPLTEPGLERINYKTKGWTDPASIGSIAGFQGFIDGTVKPATIWDPRFFFNIWISDASPSLFILGYSTFPAGSGLAGIGSGIGTATNDGLWIWTKAFGNIGTLHAVYNKGRSAVHETGHWLGLRHIGGDASAATGDCNATDFCNDTPAQKGGAFGGTNGQNLGAPAYPLHANVCSSAFGDMFMNFMDYTDDNVMAHFTPDQAIRMQTAMSNSLYRNALSASSATQCTINYLTLAERDKSDLLTLYPNPVAGEINLVWKGGENQNVRIDISNLVGAIMLSTELSFGVEHKASMDLRALPSGVYFLTLVTAFDRVVKKMTLTD